MDRTFRIILILFITVALLSIGVVVISMNNIKRAAKAADWVNHTHAFIAETNAIVAALRSAEGALHTYLLTSDDRHRDAFRDAYAELAEHVEVAKALAATDEKTAADMAAFEAALNERATGARTLLAHHRAEEFDTVKELLTSDTNSDQQHEIIRQAARIRAEQIEELNRRDQEAYHFDQTARTSLFVGASLNVLILLSTAWFIRDDLASRRQAAALLQADNERLETRVRERTAELSEANRQLKTENLEGRWKNQALAHQLRYNHLIVDSISELVFVITKARNISRINPAVSRTTGFDLIALVDHSLDDFVQLDVPAGDTQLVEPINDSLRSGQDLRNQSARLRNRHGDFIPVRFSLFPLRDNDKVVGGVVTLHLRDQAD